MTAAAKAATTVGPAVAVRGSGVEYVEATDDGRVRWIFATTPAGRGSVAEVLDLPVDGARLVAVGPGPTVVIELGGVTSLWLGDVRAESMPRWEVVVPDLSKLTPIPADARGWAGMRRRSS